MSSLISVYFAVLVSYSGLFFFWFSDRIFLQGTEYQRLRFVANKMLSKKLYGCRQHQKGRSQ